MPSAIAHDHTNKGGKRQNAGKKLKKSDSPVKLETKSKKGSLQLNEILRAKLHAFNVDVPKSIANSLQKIRNAQATCMEEGKIIDMDTYLKLLDMENNFLFKLLPYTAPALKPVEIDTSGKDTVNSKTPMTLLQVNMGGSPVDPREAAQQVEREVFGKPIQVVSEDGDEQQTERKEESGHTEGGSPHSDGRGSTDQSGSDIHT